MERTTACWCFLALSPRLRAGAGADRRRDHRREARLTAWGAAGKQRAWLRGESVEPKRERAHNEQRDEKHSQQPAHEAIVMRR